MPGSGVWAMVKFNFFRIIYALIVVLRSVDRFSVGIFNKIKNRVIKSWKMKKIGLLFSGYFYQLATLLQRMQNHTTTTLTSVNPNWM